MATWAETQGRMVSGYVASGGSYDQSSGSYQTYHEPVVTYQYEVNGVQYTGSRIAELSARYGSRSDVEKFLADHPVGSTVKVYYDPADPANPIFEKGLGSIGNKQLALAGGIIGGTLAAAGGLSILVLGLTLIFVCALLAGVLWVISQVLQF